MAGADQTGSAVVGANGTATVSFRPTRGQNWSVQQVSVSAPTVGGNALCNIYRDTTFVAAVNPSRGVAAGEPFIPCRNGSTFYIRWTNATVGAPCEVLIIYDDGND